MTFKDIAIKNFKGNMKKYIIYYLSSSFIVATFFMYSTLIFNDKLKSSKNIGNDVFSALTAPNVALGIFALFFISYSYLTFIKLRKREFGLYMSLGMSAYDIKRIILYENLILTLGAIVLGWVTGLVFSRLFFIIVAKILGVNEANYSVGLKNFVFSAGIFLGIDFINLLNTITEVEAFEINELLKAERKIETNRSNNPTLALIGMGIISGSSIFLYKQFIGENNSTAFLQSVILIPIGLYMVISELGGTIIKFSKKNKRIYYNNVLIIANISRKFKQTKKIIFIISILVAVIIFYVGSMFSLMTVAEREAVKNNSYDISYAEIRDKNIIAKDFVEEIAHKNGERITEHKELEFIYYYDMKLTSTVNYIMMMDKEINKLGKVKLNVDKGSYVTLSQMDSGRVDKSDRDKRSPLSLRFNSSDHKFKNQDKIFKEVFRRVDNEYSEIIVLNEEDYNDIKKECDSYELGKFQFYNFTNWKNTRYIAEDIEKELQVSNKNKKKFVSRILSDREDNLLGVSSRVQWYRNSKQGAAVLLIISSYIGLFFFISTVIILFLKLLSDIDSDKVRFKNMYKIGATDAEIRKQVAIELKLLFFIGPIIGIIIAFIYTLTFAQDASQDARKYYIYSNLVLSSIFIIIQIIYYFVCKKVYCESILGTIE